MNRVEEMIRRAERMEAVKQVAAFTQPLHDLSEEELSGYANILLTNQDKVNWSEGEKQTITKILDSWEDQLPIVRYTIHCAFQYVKLLVRK